MVFIKGPVPSSTRFEIMIKIQINGEEKNIEEGFTLNQLVPRLLETPYCAIAVNEKVIPKINRNEIILKDGDRVEIIEPVGGG